MAIVGDSGGIFALYDAGDVHHVASRSAIAERKEKIIIPSAVLGEIDYLLRKWVGIRGSLRFLADIEAGAFEIESTTKEDLRRSREVLSKYADLNLGLGDAVVVAVAERLKIDTVLTVDERDFRVIRSIHGRPFRLLPADRKKR